MPTKDYYTILGVQRAASADEIKRAYRNLARTHHPDVADDKNEAEHRFKDINEAYGVLSDPNKRARYDQFGTADGTNGADFGFGGFGPSGFGDIFDMFFGEAAPRSRAGASAPRRGEDLRYDLQITLEEAFSGTTRDVQYRHLASCASCKGSGAEPGSMVLPCDRCGGTGMARTVRQTPLGQFVTQSECQQCGGDGHVITKSCHECLGRGRIEADRRLTVKIPAGVDDGSRIRIAGSGHAGTLGGSPGDLYVYVGVSPHAVFRREGTDTFLDVPISFPQAALGAEISVPSLEGELPLTIAPGTQTGTRMRMRGRGMPNVRGSSRGDHHVTVHVAVPSKLNKKQREMLEEYAKAGGDDIDDRSFFERVKDAFRPD
jgi:molecular chaperone DnaJ